MNGRILLALVVAGALSGCVVQPGYYEGGYYEEEYTGPDFILFGSFDHGHEHGEHERERGHEREHSDREASHRGSESRGEAGHERPAGHTEPSSGGHGGHEKGDHDHK